MKKVFILTAALLVMIGVQAQSGLPEKLENIKGKLDPATIAGIQTYDADVLIKAMKVRKIENKLEVAKLVNQYNSNLKSLKSGNTALLGKFGKDLVQLIKGKEMDQIWTARSDYKDRLESIRDQSTEYMLDFETQLLEVTKKRQQRKYFKYKKQMQENEQESVELGDVFSYIGM